MANEVPTPKLPDVSAAENATVGESEVHEAEVVVVNESLDIPEVPAKVPARQAHVHETHVATDRVITDPTDPLAVQIPDAGRGNLDLPIHGLAAPKPEDVFAAEAKKPAAKK